MVRKENIVSYASDEIAAMRARGESQTDWAKMDDEAAAQLAADTASDPARDGIPEDWRKHKKAIHIRLGPTYWNSSSAAPGAGKAR